jgi:hypothetical protein
MQTVEIEGKKYEITGNDVNGVPVIKGFATTINHTDEQGNQIFDEQGNPKQSVHISVSPVEEKEN